MKSNNGGSEAVKTVDIQVVLETVNRLLAEPLGSQMYAKDIRNLLDIVQLQRNPPIVIKQNKDLL